MPLLPIVLRSPDQDRPGNRRADDGCRLPGAGRALDRRLDPGPPRPEPGGHSADQDPPVRPGPTAGRRREVSLQGRIHARSRRQGLVLLRPHDDFRHGDRGLRRDPLRQLPAGRHLPGKLGRPRTDQPGDRAGRRRGHDLRLRHGQHRRLRRGAGRLGQQQQVQFPGRAAEQRPVDRLRTAHGTGHPGRGAQLGLVAIGHDHGAPGARRGPGTPSCSRWG